MTDPAATSQHQPNFLHRIAFDPTLNLGHILTTFTMIGAVFMWGQRLESRVDTEIEIRKLQIMQIEKDRNSDAQIMGEVKATLLRIENKLDGKADKAR